MAKDPPSADRARALALARAAAQMYRQRQVAAQAALNLLHYEIVAASQAGASVTELNEATGLSRPAIYRALHRERV